MREQIRYAADFDDPVIGEARQPIRAATRAQLFDELHRRAAWLPVGTVVDVVERREDGDGNLIAELARDAYCLALSHAAAGKRAFKWVACPDTAARSRCVSAANAHARLGARFRGVPVDHVHGLECLSKNSLDFVCGQLSLGLGGKR